MDPVEVRVHAMLAEYAALNQEIVNRGQQQHALIAVSWGIAIGGGIGGFIAFDPSKLLPDQLQDIQFLLLLIPIVLSVLTGNFIRNEEKVLQIVKYLYQHLRPAMSSVIDGNESGSPSVVWMWPDLEYEISMRSKVQKLSRPVVELCRYLIMHVPAILLLLQAYMLCGASCSIYPLKHLFFLNIAVVAVFLGMALVTLLRFYSFHKSFQRLSQGSRGPTQ